MQTIFKRSFIALLATLGLALASCSGGDISRGRAAATSSAGSAGTAAQATATAAPAIVDAPPTPQQAATPRPPCTNGVVPPSTPSLIWCDGSSPNCQPTPDYQPAQCPCATGAEIDAALNSNEPWTCASAGGGQ